MVDFPYAEAVDALLASAQPLPVLFGHACSRRAHELHQQLAARFAAAGLKLLCDPFGTGDDVQVAMERLQIHGLLFHATLKSLESKACAKELETACRLAAKILCLRDKVKIPKELLNRIYLDLPEAGEIDPCEIEKLVGAMGSRARVHWVWQWMLESGRAVEEREAGANWLLKQSSQVLAEFFEPLARLHRLEKEDPTVSARLAAVLGQTGLPAEAKGHLLRWWYAVENPLSRMTIEDVLSAWDVSAPFHEDPRDRGTECYRNESQPKTEVRKANP